MPEHPKRRITGILLLGLVFHICYIGTVFDCYFANPVVTGMQRYRPQFEESKRLVLVVGDGLRADLLFSASGFPSVPGAQPIAAPYLRSIIETRGAFGVSHTRIPTESRPGHVALIGGMYEDASEVTKGWQTNPVDFDSVFNQTSHTFSFGSEDVLHMFSRGATAGKVNTWSYNQSNLDYTKDASFLDRWVFDQFRDLLHNASINHDLDTNLRSNQVVIFLHLLGTDMAGHSYRPHSREYWNSIRLVDSIVRETETIISDFFQDNETSFIFTADHGMSAIGNHGNGDPDSTRTPFVAWGRGIRGPLADSSPSSHDSYSASWKLNHLLRRDIEQADVAAIMSTLLGIDWPINSVGVLPDIDPTRPGYLLPDGGEETLAEAGFINAKVLVEHYRVKHELRRACTQFYRPFINLEGSPLTTTPPRMQKLSAIEAHIRDRDWHTARRTSLELINSTLDGLHYLQTYDRYLIFAFVIAAYTGWAAYTSSTLIYDSVNSRSYRGSWIATLTIGLVLAICWRYLAMQQSPMSFYCYVLFPCFFWERCTVRAIPLILSRISDHRSVTKRGLWRPFTCCILVGTVLFGMVLAYTHRALWSIASAIGAVWPLITLPAGAIRKSKTLLITWSTACMAMAIFPLLSVEKVESLSLTLLGGMGILVAGSVAAVIFSKTPDGHVDLRLWIMFGTQSALIAMMTGITAVSAHSLQSKNGLPAWSQVLGWIILVTSSLLPLVSWLKYPNPTSKLLSYVLGFAPCFIILSIDVEGLFYLTYCLTLFVWVEVEVVVRQHLWDNGREPLQDGYHLSADNLRIGLFFLFFVQIAFFGPGNTASISSFYLESIYRLVAVYNPFLVLDLLMLKLVVPYIVLAAALATLTARLALQPFTLLLTALAIADAMTLAFFFRVSDTGTWQDISRSLDAFCLSSVLLACAAGIGAAGEAMMRGTLVGLRSHAKRE